jgi:hypothetical protein
MTETRDWSAMMASHAALLERRTGAAVAEWNSRVRSSGADRDEAALRAWLTDQGVTGHPQQLLVFERFGCPEFLVASADELIDGHYADRVHLRPISTACWMKPPASARSRCRLARATSPWSGLAAPLRWFAPPRSSASTWVSRLEGRPSGGRLRSAGGLANDSITVRVELVSPGALDEDAISLLRLAYQANL